MGRTHGIHAEPTTFGLKLALWYDEVRRRERRFQEAAETMRVGKLSGAVRTFAHRRRKSKKSPWQSWADAYVATQVIRAIATPTTSPLALIGATLEKIAVEVRHLQRTEVREAEEYFSPGQKGSSAMPHKRNPSPRADFGLARILRSNAMAAMENVALWHSGYFALLGGATIFPDSTSHRLPRIRPRLWKDWSYPERMAANLELTRGLVYSGELPKLVAGHHA